MTRQLVSAPGLDPVWKDVPGTAAQALSMPNAAAWEMKMNAFIDKTASVDGFEVITAGEAKRLKSEGVKFGRLGWVFKYKGSEEHARLVYQYSKHNSSFEALTFSNVAKPLHWKRMLHLGLTDGASCERIDIVNAHQSVRISPADDSVYTNGFPGIPKMAADGSEGFIKWNNMLNGMPPVGRAFTLDAASHIGIFGMKPTCMDDYVY
eukprot:4385927-Prymnesium_polylepis.1